MPVEGKTKARGYGARHKQHRKAWARLVATGSEKCRRCGNLIGKDEPFDLDHTDDRTGYLGPSHQRCNRNTAQRGLTLHSRRGLTLHSRVW
jgi:hypothetical protein